VFFWPHVGPETGQLLRDKAREMDRAVPRMLDDANAFLRDPSDPSKGRNLEVSTSHYPTLSISPDSTLNLLISHNPQYLTTDSINI